MDTGTAAYYMDQDYMRIKMDGWGLLLTKRDVEKGWKREKSVRRNNPDFMKPKNKGKIPDLYK